MSFQGQLRAQLLAAGVRRNRLRRATAAGLVAGAVIVAGTLVSWPGDDAPAMAAVQVSVEDGLVEVRLSDEGASIEQVEAALEPYGFDIRFEAVPVGPSRVGRFLGEIVTDEQVQPVSRVEVAGVTYQAFTFPAGWQGSMTVSVGVPAEPGQPYSFFSLANGPGEPLACQPVLGQRLRTVADALVEQGVDVRVIIGDPSRAGSSEPIPYERALGDGAGTRPVTSAVMLSATEAVVDVDVDWAGTVQDPC